jgi:hypothetical protein
MKLYAPLLAVLLAVPAVAQTTSGTDANDPEDTLSLRAGTAFYTDDTYTTMRSAEELQTNWATLSVEDQTAIRTRCDEIIAAATEMEPSNGGNAVEGATDGAVTADESSSTEAEDMGFMADETKLRPLCDAIAGY